LGAVEIIENALTREFAREERSNLTKFLAMVRTGRIWSRIWMPVLKKTVYRRTGVPQRVQLRASQLDDERRVRGMRTVLDFSEDYDCVVSWEESLCNYVLSARIGAKRKIGYIHPDYIQAGFYSPPDRRMLYGLDVIAFVSEPNRDSFCRAVPELGPKSVAIPNVLSVATIRRLARVEPAVEMECLEFSILTVCRLQNASKALDRAARVCARMKREGLRFKWFFVGSGPDREMLEALIGKFGIERELILLGERKNPYPYMLKADLLVLQSYYEGRPLVIDEAKVVGTPVFVTDYASARGQVVPGVEGFVVSNNEASVLEGLSRIVRDPSCLEEIRNLLSGRSWEELANCDPLLDACGWQG
jgi:glycosyltransferase involved in cell wall biosynthesis